MFAAATKVTKPLFSMLLITSFVVPNLLLAVNLPSPTPFRINPTTVLVGLFVNHLFLHCSFLRYYFILHESALATNFISLTSFWHWKQRLNPFSGSRSRLTQSYRQTNSHRSISYILCSDSIIKLLPEVIKKKEITMSNSWKIHDALMIITAAQRREENVPWNYNNNILSKLLLVFI